MRLGTVGMRIHVPLDPNDRQDDDRCGFLRSVTPETHNAPLVREFDYVTHQPLSPAAASALYAALGISMIKRHARLTLC